MSTLPTAPATSLLACAPANCDLPSARRLGVALREGARPGALAMVGDAGVNGGSPPRAQALPSPTSCPSSWVFSGQLCPSASAPPLLAPPSVRAGARWQKAVVAGGRCLQPVPSQPVGHTEFTFCEGTRCVTPACLFSGLGGGSPEDPEPRAGPGGLLTPGQGCKCRALCRNTRELGVGRPVLAHSADVAE